MRNSPELSEVLAEVLAAKLEGAARRDEFPSGLLLVTGRDRASLLQRITTSDVAGLAPGESRITCFTTAKGRVLDRVRVLAAADACLIVTSAGRSEAIAKWIDRYVITEDCQVLDLSPLTTRVATCGARAMEVATALLGHASLPARNGHVGITLASGATVTLVRIRSLLDHDGLLAIAPREAAQELGAALEDAARRAGIPVLSQLDDAEYEAARIASGLPRYGADVTEDHNPLESGLWDAVAFDKGCYVGQEVVARLRNYDKVMKQLCVLSFADPAVAPRVGDELIADGRQVGVLTSVAGPPHLTAWRALGYVGRRTLQAGTPITLGASDPPRRVAGAEIVNLAQ
jgi:folate-binding protein YgfZ